MLTRKKKGGKRKKGEERKKRRADDKSEMRFSCRVEDDLFLAPENPEEYQRSPHC